MEAYAGRLRNKQAEKLRMQVEVLVHVQLPAQLFKSGLDPGVKSVSRVPTPEKKASYNWVRRDVEKPDTVWPNDTIKELNIKLSRVTRE